MGARRKRSNLFKNEQLLKAIDFIEAYQLYISQRSKDFCHCQSIKWKLRDMKSYSTVNRKFHWHLTAKRCQHLPVWLKSGTQSNVLLLPLPELLKYYSCLKSVNGSKLKPKR